MKYSIFRQNQYNPFVLTNPLHVHDLTVKLRFRSYNFSIVSGYFLSRRNWLWGGRRPCRCRDLSSRARAAAAAACGLTGVGAAFAPAGWAPAGCDAPIISTLDNITASRRIPARLFPSILITIAIQVRVTNKAVQCTYKLKKKRERERKKMRSRPRLCCDRC